MRRYLHKKIVNNPIVRKVFLTLLYSGLQLFATVFFSIMLLKADICRLYCLYDRDSAMSDFTTIPLIICHSYPSVKLIICAVL